MGRRPKAEAEKRLTGAGRRPLRGESAASPAKAKPMQPPSWLTGPSARAVWKRVVPELQRVNFLNDSFRDPLGRYCVHLAEWIRLTKEIKRDGATMMVKMTNSEERMPRMNPAIRVRDTIEKSLIDLEDRFGLSTLARYRVISHQAANPQRDLFGHSADTPDADERQAARSMPPPAKASSPIGLLN